MHTLGTNANLISRRQIHRESYTLKIVSQRVETWASGVIAQFMSSNLYFITIFSLPTIFFSAFTALNPYLLDIWYSRLGHLRKQNIVKWAEVSEEVYLSQPSSSKAYAPCACVTLQVKNHINSPLSNTDKQDLIYSDAIRPFSPTFNEIQYVIIFRDDDIEESQVCSLKQKSEVFQAFQIYLAWNERCDL